MNFDETNFPELPSSWTSVSVDQACDLVIVKDKIQAKSYLESGSLAVVDQGLSLVGGYTNVTSAAIQTNLPAIVFGDHTRAIKYIDFPFAAGADGIKVLRPAPCLLPRLFFYFLKAIRLPDKGYARHFQHLRTARIAVPPLNEQKRIADKLDALLARVDACRERLDRIPAILKRFRQSVLAAATSGKLTEEWREEAGFPFEWEESTFGSIGTVSGGLTKNAKRRFLEMHKPYLRVANVYANRLELGDIAEIGLSVEEYKKTKLIDGDLLIVEGNGSLDQIGRAAMWNGEIADCVHQNHIIRWRSNRSVLPEFALFWLLSPQGRSSLVKLASSTTGLHTLSISKVAAIPVMVPPLGEQHEIVRRVESLFAYADRLEAHYNTARDQVKRLTPVLLAKAFRGKLVPQDPNDEPASVLLERIRAARAAQPHKKRNRRNNCTNEMKVSA